MFGGITSAVVIPPIVEEYKLTKSVEANLDILVSSDYQAPSEETNINNSENSNAIVEEVKQEADYSKPLTFKIVPYQVKVENIKATITEQSGDIVDEPITYLPEKEEYKTAYKIVPSYDKPISQWSKQEKKAFDEKLQEINKIYDADFQASVESSKQELNNATQAITAIMDKVDNSYSKDYNLCWVANSNGTSTFEAWRYNTYTKLYTGTTQDEYKTVTYYIDKSQSVPNGVEYTGISIQDFRTTVYSSLKQKINSTDLIEEDKQVALDNLNQLYHLSD